MTFTLSPKADPSSPFPASRNFNVDKNNVAPRFGIVYALRQGPRPLVIRAAAGLYYERPWLNLYNRALQDNGNPRFSSYRFSRTQNPQVRPEFPNTFSGVLPQGTILLGKRSLRSRPIWKRCTRSTQTCRSNRPSRMIFRFRPVVCIRPVGIYRFTGISTR